jgi:hypothetical protein
VRVVFTGMLLAFTPAKPSRKLLVKTLFVHHDSTFWVLFLSTMSHFNIDPFSSPHLPYPRFASHQAFHLSTSPSLSSSPFLSIPRHSSISSPHILPALQSLAILHVATSFLPSPQPTSRARYPLHHRCGKLLAGGNQNIVVWTCVTR